LDPLLHEMFHSFPREAAVVFGPHASLATPEGQAAVVRKKLELATRIDMVASQVLGMAVTFVHTICTLAAIEGGAYAVVLARSLRIGFLVNLQSMLSTAGNELGMIEDLDCAALWLSLVRVRFVEDAAASAAGAAGATEECAPSSLSIRRDSQGRFLVDLGVAPRVAAAIRAALSAMQGYTPRAEGASGRRDDDGLFGPGAGPDGAGDQPEASPPALATAELFGVAFTQGVNEMQFVVNTFVPLEARHQANINLESLARLERYYESYRHALAFQLYRIELRRLDEAGVTRLSVAGEVEVLAEGGAARVEALRAARLVQRVLDENDR